MTVSKISLTAAIIAVAAALVGLAPPARAIVEPVQQDPWKFDSATSMGQQEHVRQLIAQRRFDEALREIAALQKAEPASAAVAILAGVVYVNKGDTVHARQSFEQALALQPDSLAATLNLAQLDIYENKPDAARQRFERLLASTPNNVDAMLGLAAVAAAQNQDALYVQWLERVLQTDPGRTRARVLLAKHYLDKKDVPKALSIARQASEADPKDTLALDVLGSAQFAARLPNDAVETYSRLTRVARDDPDAYYKLATAYVAANSLSAARAQLTHALLLKPDFLDAQVLLATIELSSGRPAEALKIARAIEARDPKSAAGLTLEGEARLAQQDAAGAQKAFQAAWSIRPTGLLAMRQHQALSRLGREAEGEAIVRGWLNDHHDDATTRLYLASRYLAARHYDRAADEFRRVLQVEPRNVAALNDLAWTYQQLRDPRAVQTAESAFALAPADPQVMDTLGWIVLEKGDVSRAVDLLTKAADASPQSDTIQYHLAVATNKSGDKARARRQLERLLASKKAFPQRAEAEALLRTLPN